MLSILYVNYRNQQMLCMIIHCKYFVYVPKHRFFPVFIETLFTMDPVIRKNDITV